MFTTEIKFRAAIGSNTRGKTKINDVVGNLFTTVTVFGVHFSLLYVVAKTM